MSYLTRAMIFGGLFGVLLSISGVHFPDWRFWLLMVGATLLREFLPAKEWA